MKVGGDVYLMHRLRRRFGRKYVSFKQLPICLLLLLSCGFQTPINAVSSLKRRFSCAHSNTSLLLEEKSLSCTLQSVSS